jgi:hypothetical protein
MYLRPYFLPRPAYMSTMFWQDVAREMEHARAKRNRRKRKAWLAKACFFTAVGLWIGFAIMG